MQTILLNIEGLREEFFGSSMKERIPKCVGIEAEDLHELQLVGVCERVGEDECIRVLHELHAHSMVGVPYEVRALRIPNGLVA